MPTIIDSLIVELGLDSKKFTQGQKEATDSLRRLEKDSEKHLKSATSHSDKLTQSLSLVQGRLLAIASIFLGGMGVTKFAEQITKLTAQTGYLSTSLGVSTKELGKWQSVAASVGATSDDVASSIAAIQKNFATFQLHGTSPLHSFAYSMGLNLQDANGKNKSPTDIAMMLSEWASKQKDKNIASQALSEVGMSPGMTSLLMLGPEELKKRLAQYEKYAPTEDQTKKLQKLQEIFGQMTESAAALGRALLVKLVPVIEKVINLVTKVFDYFGSKDASPDKVADDLNSRTNGGFKKSIIGRSWDWVKGKFGYGTPEAGGGAAGGGAAGSAGSGAAGAAGGGAAGGGGATTGSLDQTSNGTLAEQRRQFAQELENNPELRDKVMRIMYNEQGSHPEGTQAVAESMMNRAIIRRTNLAREGRWTGENGYYEQGNMGRGALENPKIRAILEQSLQNALGGGNVSDYATDNASQWLAAKHKSTGNFLATRDIHGETFFSPDTRIPSHISRWRAWKEQTEAQERVRRGGFGSPENSIALGGTRGINGPSANLLNNYYGARNAITGGDTTTNNTTSSTHIGSMNVTVPPGADPAAYGQGIRQELMRTDPVFQSTTGMR